MKILNNKAGTVWTPKNSAPTVCRDRFPHECVECGSPAWNCFSGGQECSNDKCENYVVQFDSASEVDESIDLDYRDDGDTLVLTDLGGAWWV